MNLSFFGTGTPTEIPLDFVDGVSGSKGDTNVLHNMREDVVEGSFG